MLSRLDDSFFKLVALGQFGFRKLDGWTQAGNNFLRVPCYFPAELFRFPSEEIDLVLEVAPLTVATDAHKEPASTRGE